jgi:hypothetical protein
VEGVFGNGSGGRGAIGIELIFADDLQHAPVT